MPSYPPIPPNGKNGWHPIETPPPHILITPEWEKQPGESHQAFAAFRIFRDLGSQRSMDAAYQRRERSSGVTGGKVTGRWHTWRAQWRWNDRVDAWDRHIDAETRAAAEARARADGERLAEQRSAQRAAELELGDLLLARARQMLTLPVIEQEVESTDPETGRPLHITLKAAPKWSFRDAGRFIDIATQLRRLALDMETSRTTVNVDIEDEVRQLAAQFGFDAEAAVELAREFVNEKAS